jgi:hypothetical protein
MLPDSEITGYTYRFTDTDKLVWELKSQRALVFSKQGLKKIEGVDLKFYKKGRLD